MLAKNIKRIALLCSLLLSANSQPLHASEFSSSNLEKESSFSSKIYDKLASLDIHFNGDIFDFDIINGINLSSKYRYEVEDSYQAQFHSRIDKWDVNVEVSPLELVDNFISSPLSFKLNKKTSVLFVRQFASKKEALKALPYSFNKLPLKAQDVVTKLNVGDLVIIPAQMNIILEASSDFLPFNSQGVSANANYQWVLSGKFNIQVFKLNNEKVRLKILSESSQSQGPGVNLRPSFDIFGLELVDKQVKKIFNLNKELLSYNYRYNSGSQIILDYVFDLKDQDAQAAYNQILGSSYKFKDLGVIQKLSSYNNESTLNKNANSMLVSFDMAEKIALEDAGKNLSNKRINRIFKGLNQFKAKDKKIAINVMISKWNKDSIYSFNKITQMNEFDESVVFYNPSLIKYKNLEIGKGVLKTKEQVSVNHFGLLAKEKADIFENFDLGIRYQRTDKTLTKYEANQIEDIINGNIPREIINQMPFETLGKEKKSTLIEIEYIIKSEGLRSIPLVSESDLRERLKEYMSSALKYELINDKKSKWEILKDLVIVPNIKRKLQINGVARDLHALLKVRDQDPQAFLEGIVALNDKAVFKDVGLGVLSSFIPKNKLNKSIYVNTKIHLSKDNQINFTFGELENRGIHDQLKYIQSKINSTSFDLRLDESTY